MTTPVWIEDRRASARRVLMGDLTPIMIIAGIVVVIEATLQGNLFSQGNLARLLVQLAPFVLTAMAQSLVMLLAGVDLSVGALMSLGSALLATRLVAGGAVNLAVVCGVLAICATLNALTGVLVAAMRLPAIVVTLATSFLWGGAALYVLPEAGGEVPKATALWLTGVFGGVPLVGILLLLCCAVWWFLRGTRGGLRIYAVGARPAAARTSGLSPVRAHALAYGFAGLLTGLAALVVSAQTGSGDPLIGNPFTLTSIAAAVLGGVAFTGGEGKIAGAVAGAVVMGMIVNLLLYAGVSSFYQYVVEGIVLLLAVVAGLARAQLRRHRTVPAAPITASTSEVS